MAVSRAVVKEDRSPLSFPSDSETSAPLLFLQDLPSLPALVRSDAVRRHLQHPGQFGIYVTPGVSAGWRGSNPPILDVPSLAL